MRSGAQVQGGGVRIRSSIAAMNVLEGYGAALFRLSQTVDPVVLIWTSTFALALAYFFIAKLVEPLFPTQQNTR